MGFLVRFAILGCVVALTASSCGKKKDKNTENTENKTTTADEPPAKAMGGSSEATVVLESAGEEPRRVLAYGPKSGTRKVTLTIQSGPPSKKPIPEDAGPGKSPGFASTFELDWNRPAALTQPWTFEVTKATLVERAPGANIGKEEAAIIENIEKVFVGTKGRLDASSSSSFNLVKTVGLPTRPEMAEVLYMIATPLPPEPVGVGGKWSMTQTRSFPDLKGTVHRTYRVMAIDGDNVSLRVEGTIKDPGGTVVATTKGVLTVGLDDFLPAQAKVAETWTQELKLPDGSSESLSIRLTAEIR